MKTLIAIVFQVLTVLFVAHGAQALRLEHITTDNGLPDNHVNQVLKDKQGFLWIATEDGLVRYDGNNFKVFKHEEGNPHSLSGNKITTIFEDKDGILWVALDNQKGLNSYNYKTETFTSFVTDKNIDKTILKIFQSSDGLLWFGGWDGLCVYDKVTGHFDLYSSKNGLTNLNDGRIFEIVEDDNKQVWVLTFSPMANLYRRATKDFEQVNVNLSGNFWKRIIKDSKGNFYVTCYGCGLYKFSPQSKQIVEAYTGETSLSYAYRTGFEAPNGDIWLGSDGNGITVFDPTKKTFSPVAEEADPSGYMTISNVFQLYRDPSGITWVCSSNKGLGFYDATKIKFTLFDYKPGQPDRFTDKPPCFTYINEKQQVFVCTNGGGLWMFNRENKLFTPLNIYNQNEEIYLNIKAICETNNGNLLVGTSGNGVAYYDMKTGRTSFLDLYEVHGKGLMGRSVTSMIKTTSGRIFVGYNVNNGWSLQEFFEKDTSFSSTKVIKELEMNVVTLYEDASSNVWIGTMGHGVFKLRPDGSYQWINYVEGRKNGLSSDDIRTIYQDKNQVMWFGNEGFGIDTYNTLTGEWNHINETNGLPSNMIRGILQDQSGNMWISTARGLSKYELSTGSIINFGVSDGIQPGAFSNNCAGAFTDGTFLFGGSKGLNLFKPDSVELSVVSPKIILSNLSVLSNMIKPGDKTSILKKPISITDTLILSYEHVMFAIEYSAMVFSNQHKVAYAYKLDGFDNQWINAGNERKATYTNIGSGTYTFRVKATNNDGVWGRNEAKIVIIITPPVWQTWWFRTLAIIALVGLSFFLFKVFIIRKQKAELEQHVKERTAELSTTLNNLTQMQSQLVKSEKLATIGTLSASIAHEIKNPVNFIYSGIGTVMENYNEMQLIFHEIDNLTKDNIHEVCPRIIQLKEDLEFDKLNERTTKLLTVIENGALRTVEIAQALRNFSRSDSDEIREIDLHENLNVTLVILKGQYKDRIEIIKDYGQIPKITCYPGKLNQVFMNLLDNAIQAINKQGSITIKTRSLGDDKVQVTISDTGNGMSSEVLQHIFDTFFTTKEAGKGTGLGLSIAKELVEKHHGTIEVTSKEGEGSTFTITLFTKII